MAYKFETVTFRIEHKDRQELEALAESKNMSLSEVIRDIIQSYLTHEAQQSKVLSDIMKRLDTLADKKKIDNVENELMRYLQQILYHAFRVDMWNIEYAKNVHKDNFAHALDKKVEDLAKKHSE
jgi:hypothetical protein